MTTTGGRWLDPLPNGHSHPLPTVDDALVGLRWQCDCGVTLVVTQKGQQPPTWELWRPKPTPTRPDRDEQ